LATKPTVGLRYYNPQTGRYISRDPHGYPNGLDNYLYVNDNPINRIDPLGLMWGWLGDAANGVANAAKAAGNFAADTAKSGLGVAAAVIHDNFNVGVDPATISDPAFTRGATLGHEIVVAQAIIETAAGGTGVAAGSGMAATGAVVTIGGLVAEAPSLGTSTAVVAAGGAITISGEGVAILGGVAVAHGLLAGTRALDALRNQSSGTAGSGPEGGGPENTGTIVGHPSQPAARRAADRDAGMGVHGGREELPDQPLRAGSQSPTGERGVRTETKSTDTGDVVHHDPYGTRYDDGTVTPPHYGVDRNPAGPRAGEPAVHHTYPSDHDPTNNR
jgi:hypothetical protein